MEENERKKQRVYDHIGTALESIGMTIGGAYGLDLDNGATRRICLAQLFRGRHAIDEAIVGIKEYGGELAVAPAPEPEEERVAVPEPCRAGS